MSGKHQRYKTHKVMYHVPAREGRVCQEYDCGKVCGQARLSMVRSVACTTHASLLPLTLPAAHEWKCPSVARYIVPVAIAHLHAVLNAPHVVGLPSKPVMVADGCAARTDPEYGAVHPAPDAFLLSVSGTHPVGPACFHCSHHGSDVVVHCCTADDCQVHTLGMAGQPGLTPRQGLHARVVLRACWAGAEA
jgi:hypothetical protein